MELKTIVTRKNLKKYGVEIEMDLNQDDHQITDQLF